MISTRRFFGSKMSSGVRTSSAASPCDGRQSSTRRARLDEERAHRVGALQSELHVGRAASRSCRCGRTTTPREPDALDGVQDVLHERAAFLGQLLGLELEGQGEVSRRGWQRGEEAAEQLLHLVVADDGHLGRRPVEPDERRLPWAGSSTEPVCWSFCEGSCRKPPHGPSCRLESGSSMTRVAVFGSGGASGVRTCFGPQADSSPAAVALSRATSRALFIRAKRG